MNPDFLSNILNFFFFFFTTVSESFSMQLRSQIRSGEIIKTNTILNGRNHRKTENLISFFHQALY